MCNSYEDFAAFAQDEFHVDMGDICLSSPAQPREWLAGEVIAYLDRRSVELYNLARAERPANPGLPELQEA